MHTGIEAIGAVVGVPGLGKEIYTLLGQASHFITKDAVQKIESALKANPIARDRIDIPELKEYLKQQYLSHTRGKPFHPMTQGKIERFHRSMKNVINLNHYYLPWDLEEEIDKFVNYYNYQRYHEGIQNLTPADVYAGKDKEIINKRSLIKKKTMQLRRLQNLKNEKKKSVCIY